MKTRFPLLAALAAALCTVPVQSATAAPVPQPSTVDIVVTPDGFQAPPAVRAGAVTLNVRSADPEGAWIGLVRLRPGATLDRYLGHLRQSMGDDPAAAVAGGKAVAEDVVMLGGAAAAAVPASATIQVGAGTHYLIDFRDVDEPDLASRVRAVEVVPQRNQAAPPRVTDRVIHGETPNGPRFLAPGRLAVGAGIEVVNLSCQFNEAMLMPVREGTTAQDIGNFFTTVDQGGWPGSSPFAGGPTGVVPLSPGRSAVLASDLPAGRYALVTWVRDLRTGHLFAAEGMHALITVG